MNNQIPFSWQDKRVLRKIREGCEDYATATLVYLGLTVAASDLCKNEFQTTHAWLAQLTGLSDRTIRRRLDDLQRIGVIKITTPPLKAPSTYTLLAIGHDGRTIGHDGRAFGHGEATSMAVIRRNVRKEEEEVLGNGPGRAASLKMAVSERIGVEHQLEILKKRLRNLQAETEDEWQRQERPEKVKERKQVELDIKAVEDRLLQQ